MNTRDGPYLATCKEKNALSAAMNGHGAIYPRATCRITNGTAVFYSSGKEIWRCNAAYAEVHLELKPTS